MAVIVGSGLRFADANAIVQRDPRAVNLKMQSRLHRITRVIFSGTTITRKIPIVKNIATRNN